MRNRTSRTSYTGPLCFQFTISAWPCGSVEGVGSVLLRLVELCERNEEMVHTGSITWTFTVSSKWHGGKDCSHLIVFSCWVGAYR